MSLSPLLFDEVNVNYAGQAAEATTNGVQLNAIPKAGGNTFQGTLLFSGTNESLQSDNLTDRLADLGLTSTNTLKTLYGPNGSWGADIPGSFVVLRAPAPQHERDVRCRVVLSGRSGGHHPRGRPKPTGPIPADLQGLHDTVDRGGDLEAQADRVHAVSE